MSQITKACILSLVLIIAWSFFMRARFAPAPPPKDDANTSLEMPVFRKLSPYPEVTEIPAPMPVLSPNKSLVCPDGMVKVDNFCIDKYEFPNQKGKKPTNYTNWYDAKLACEAQGKRLCSEDEWVRACHTSSKSGTFNRFSYGDTFIINNCVVQSTEPQPSGSKPKCKSYYGAYDMVGNLYEWVSPIPGKKPVYAIGGSFGEGQGATCYKVGANYQPLYYQVHIGFRCCWHEAPPEEDNKKEEEAPKEPKE